MRRGPGGSTGTDGGAGPPGTAPCGGLRAGAPRVATAVALAALPALGGCLEPGEPTYEDARVAWAAYPETVVVGETFSFEAAGPASTTTCAYLDTLMLEIGDSAATVSARRRVYDNPWCSETRVSFYEVRAVEVARPGRYPVRTAGGRELGALVAVDSGRFSPLTTRGEGTVARAGGCLLFGPGWASNQRTFALRDAPEEVRRVAGTDTVVRVAGDLLGYSLCGDFGSRPTVRVDSARVTDRTVDDWYP